MRDLTSYPPKKFLWFIVKAMLLLGGGYVFIMLAGWMFISFYYTLNPDMSTSEIHLKNGGTVEIEREKRKTQAFYQPPGDESIENILGSPRPEYQAVPEAFVVGDHIIFFVRGSSDIHIRDRDRHWRKLSLPYIYGDEISAEHKTHMLQRCNLDNPYQLSLSFQQINSALGEFVVSCSSRPNATSIRFKLTSDGEQLELISPSPTPSIPDQDDKHESRPQH